MNGAYLAQFINKEGGGITGEVIQLGQRTRYVFLADCSAKEDGVTGVVTLSQLANGFPGIGFVVFPFKGDAEDLHTSFFVLFIPWCQKRHLIETVGTPASQYRHNHHFAFIALITEGNGISFKIGQGETECFISRFETGQ